LIGDIRKKVFIPTYGKNIVLNVIAAIAVVHNLGIDLDCAIEALANFQVPAGRMQFIRENVITLINDTYNASPESVSNSLDVLSQLKNKKNRTVAILADMNELGKKSYNAHLNIGKKIATLNIDFLLTVGEQAKIIVEGIKSTRAKIICSSYKDSNQLLRYLSKFIEKNDIILIKGSRNMRMEQVFDGLKKILINKN
jgi:UDP-N-acetylmuramoyl-tripeptide--D-alanyl-D-alanine ligase